MRCDDKWGEALPPAFLRAILADAREMLFIKDVHFVYLGASKAFAKLVGLDDPALVVGKTDFELFSDQELAKRYRADDERMLRLGASLTEYVEPIPSADGGTRYAATSKHIIRDETGAPMALYGVSRDITWEYKAKLSFDEELRSLFDLPDDMLCAVLFDITDWRVVNDKYRDAENRVLQRYNTIEAFLEDAASSVLAGDEARAFFHDFSRAQIARVFESGKRLLSFEYVRREPDGGKMWVREQIHLLSDPINGHLSAFFTLCRTDGGRVAPPDLSGQKELLRLLDENASVGILCATLAERHASLYYINDYLLALSGYDRAEFTARFSDNLFGLLAPEDAADVFLRLAAIAAEHGDGTVYFRVRCKDGRFVWLSDRIRYMKLENGAEILFGIVTDITEIKSQQENAEQLAKKLAQQRDAISRSADTDVMTGLFNREATMREIGAFLEGEGAHGWHALFMIDIDNFKQVNDTLGHQMGDETLTGLAQAIQSCFRDTDIVGRVGGDEFFAFMKHAQREADVRRKAQELIEALQHIYVSGTKAMELSGSIGISCYRGDGKRLSELYFEADSALYQAKSIGKNCYAFADARGDYASDALFTPPASAGSFSLRSLLNNIGGGIGIFHGTEDGCVTPLFCNESLLHLMGGLSIEQYMQLYGKDAFAGIHANDLSGVASVYETAKAARAPFRATYRVRGADMRYIWVSAVGNFVFHDDGSYDLYVVYTDATQQMLEQAELEKQFRAFQSYRRLAEKNTVACFQMNLTTNWCGAGESTDSALLGLQLAGTVDGFYAAAHARFISADELAQYQALFSRRRLLKASAEGKTSLSYEHRFCLEPGRPVWVRSVIEMMENTKTHDVEALIYALDIHQEKTMHLMVDRLLHADYRFLGLLDAKTGLLTVCGDSMNAAFDRSCCEGRSYDEFMPLVLGRFVREDYFEECARAVRFSHITRALETHASYTCNFPVARGDARGDGVYQWRSAYLDETKTVVLIAIIDITDAVLSERDPLSGILNRQGFYRRARERLESKPGTRHKLLRFDIDNFKVFNDAMGTEKGDELLRGIGATLRRVCAEPALLCARLEADHFVVLLAEDAALTEDSLLAQMSAYFSAYSYNNRLTMHMGVYPVEDCAADVSLMCDRALLALRSVKGSYSTRVGYYDNSLRAQLLEEQALSEEMAFALANGEFEIYLQPQINYEDGSLIGAEALVRWNHPTRGVLMPSVFIPLFERNGFIAALDAYVWESCCRNLRRWLDEAERYVPISVSVNISRINIYDPKLCQTLKALVEKYALPPSMLKLEITESAYMQTPQQLISVVKELRGAGFTIEMDDFGAGYSSLNTLKDVPVDILKLDVKFLSNGEDDARGGSILSSVIRMAHWLKIPVIAEGVETRTQADYLKSLNCFYMQGYYFDRPMPLDAFEKLLLRSNVGGTDRYLGVDLDGIAAFWDPSAQTALLFNSLVGGAAIMEYRDGSAEILRANDMFYAQLDTTRADYMDKQRHTLERFAGRHRAAFAAMLDDAIRTGGEAQCEAQCLPHQPGGAACWLSLRVKLLARNGEACLFYMAVENITERKRMEEELRVSQEAMRLAISKMGKTVCHFDVPTRTVTFPEAYARKHGIPGVTATVTECNAAVVAGDRAAHAAFYERICRGEQAGALLFRARNADGGYCWEQADFVTVFSDGGVPLRAVITVSDMTAQKEQEAENARTNLFIRRSGLCVVDYDAVTDSLYCKTSAPDREPVARTITGYSGQIESAASFLHEDSRATVRARLDEIVRGKPGAGSFELRVNGWGTGHRWGRLDYVSLGDASGKVYRILGQIADIQERKDSEALIARLNRTLSVKDEAYTYNNAVVERVFTLLYSSGATVATVGTVLAILGEQYDLSRMYVLEENAARSACSCIFEWCAPGVAPQIDRLQSMSYKESLGENYYRCFDERGVFFCPDVAVLSEARRKSMEALGISSFLQCAIREGGVFRGCIDFDVCNEQRVWADEQIGTLLLVSRIVGAFLMKLRKAEQAAFSQDFRAALDNSAQYVYIIDPETCEVAYCNKAIRDHAGQDYAGKVCYRAFLGRESQCENCPARVLRETGEARAAEILRPDGLLLLSQAAPLHWNGRELTLLTCTDITEMATLREMLETRADSLRVFFDALPCGILHFEVNSAGVRGGTNCNRACWSLFGYESERAYLAAVLAQRESDAIHPDDLPLVRENLRLLMESDARADYEHRVLLPGGGIRRVRALLRKLADGKGGHSIYAVFFDITEPGASGSEAQK